MIANVKPEPLQQIYDIGEAAAYLRLSHWTLRREIKAGKIRCLRLGGRILIEHSELVRLLEAARCVNTGQAECTVST
jgi:excisionase family DNA binding protein